MDVLSVSDIVVNEVLDPLYKSRIGNIDIIIGCGDLPPEYLGALRNLYDVPLFFVLGNHDIRHDIMPAGCTDITGRVVTHGGLNFLGFSGSRWYNGNANQYHEHEMRSQIRKLWFKLWRLKKLDVVVTHAPPRRIHDNEDRCHKGFKCYHTLIHRHVPRFFVHGHIHKLFKNDSDRISVVTRTQVINTFGYYTFTIDSDEFS